MQLGQYYIYQYNLKQDFPTPKILSSPLSPAVLPEHRKWQKDHKNLLRNPQKEKNAETNIYIHT